MESLNTENVVPALLTAWANGLNGAAAVEYVRNATGASEEDVLNVVNRVFDMLAKE